MTSFEAYVLESANTTHERIALMNDMPHWQQALLVIDHRMLLHHPNLVDLLPDANLVMIVEEPAYTLFDSMNAYRLGQQTAGGTVCAQSPYPQLQTLLQSLRPKATHLVVFHSGLVSWGERLVFDTLSVVPTLWNKNAVEGVKMAGRIPKSLRVASLEP